MTTTRIRLDRIGLVMLGVGDLARSLAFYRDLLGMTVQFESAEFAFLDGGRVTLALSVPLARARSGGPGATEVVFSVGDVIAAHAALAESGVSFTQPPRDVNGTSWAAN